MTDFEKADLENRVSHDANVVDKSNIEYERAQLLAQLPDPDAGKTDEERLALVS